MSCVGSQAILRGKSKRDEWCGSSALLFPLCLLLVNRFAHGGEQDNVADRLLVSHQHRQAIDADAQAAGRGHTNLQSLQEILVEHLSLVVALAALAHLVLEARALIQWIIQLGKGIAQFQTSHKRL